MPKPVTDELLVLGHAYQDEADHWSGGIRTRLLLCADQFIHMHRSFTGTPQQIDTAEVFLEHGWGFILGMIVDRWIRDAMGVGRG